MKNRKPPKSHFVLEEENGVVIATLEDAYDYSLQHTIHGMPHPKVKAPRLTKQKILENTKFKAAYFHETHEEYLQKSIKNVSHEINEHIQEIRKSLRRIQSLTHYAINAQEILNDLKKYT